MSRKFSRRTLLQGTGVAVAGALAAPYILRAAPLNAQKLRIAYVGTGGKAHDHHHFAKEQICPCYADIDEKAWGDISKIAPDAKQYTDWREMFDKHEKDIDAVVVTTPDHTHAYATMRALKAKKACYTEKPLTWSVVEARALATVATENKLATQMGNFGATGEQNWVTVEWIRAGAIGDVTEIHTWTNRPGNLWPQGIANRPAVKPVPKGVNWDVWIGPAPFRDYHDGLHAFKWRGWLDFGCGAIGDMGCHTWNAPFWAMDPDYPTDVELVECKNPSKEQYPSSSHFKWNFPAKGKRPAYVAHWYSGEFKPKMPAEYTGRVDGSMSLYIGTKGKMICKGDYGGTPNLIVGTKPTQIERVVSRDVKRDHGQDWIKAARGEVDWNYPLSNFGVGGPLTECLLLGAMVERFGKEGGKVECDPVTRTVKTQAALDVFNREPRKGWSL